MNLQKNVQTTSTKNSTFIRKLENKKIHTMIIFQRQHIQQTSQFVILYGFIMFALFGYPSATSNKKMGLLILKEFKILIKRGLGKNV